MKKNKKLPSIGARIIKSSIAVVLCILTYYIRTLIPIGNGIPFYSALAALWCIQPYAYTTRKMAEQRISGTFIGAFYGLLFLLILHFIGVSSPTVVYLAASVIIVPVLYTTVLLNKKNASFFSCVVFLSIALTHSFDDSPYIFVLNRVLDTCIGVGIGIGVNNFHIPVKHDNNTLYVSGIDDVLISESPYSIPYSKVELNRLISEGVKFTISTIHTPSELIPIMSGVNLKLPVIVMDGTALYDLNDNSYFETVPLSDEISQTAESIIINNNFQCFTSVLYDHTLLVYYNNLVNKAEIKYFEQQKCSPYCNYIHSSYRNKQNKEKVLYLTVIDEDEKIEFIKNELENYLAGKIRITITKSEYEGFSYLKIYSPLVSKKKMIEKLKHLTGTDKTITFGSIKGEYDIYIEDGGGNNTIKKLKKLYKNS
ncbi:MAG: HAD hydrolase family protein [Oscillospiraceae bacterium]